MWRNTKRVSSSGEALFIEALGVAVALACEGEITAASASAVGGIIGRAYNSAGIFFELNNCVNDAKISAKNQVAGIIGASVKTSTAAASQLKFKLLNCVNNGEIISVGVFTAGILASFNNCDPYVELCKNNGSITTSSNSYTSIKIGGIVGGCENSRPVQILKSINTGNISASDIPKSSNTEYSSAGMGGIMGILPNWSNTSNKNIIEECVNTGDLTSESVNIGGILGGTRAGLQITITDCYNTGTIKNNYGHANAAAAGILVSPTYKNTVSNCYNASDISAINASGIAVFKDDNTNLTNSYTHTGTTTQNKPSSTDVKIIDLTTNATAVTAALNNNSRSIWSTDNKSINNGMPVLSWQLQ